MLLLSLLLKKKKQNKSNETTQGIQPNQVNPSKQVKDSKYTVVVSSITTTSYAFYEDGLFEKVYCDNCKKYSRTKKVRKNSRKSRKQN